MSSGRSFIPLVNPESDRGNYHEDLGRALEEEGAKPYHIERYCALQELFDDYANIVPYHTWWVPVYWKAGYMVYIPTAGALRPPVPSLTDRTMFRHLARKAGLYPDDDFPIVRSLVYPID